MESKQLKYNTIDSILSLIDDYYKERGVAKVRSLSFDLDYYFDIFEFKVVSSMERILRIELECDLEITDEFLEKIKLYINGKM